MNFDHCFIAITNVSIHIHLVTALGNFYLLDYIYITGLETQNANDTAMAIFDGIIDQLCINSAKANVSLNILMFVSVWFLLTSLCN